MQATVNHRTIQLVEGDITDQDTDAIVNAANEYLQLGAGVAGAIRRRGGPSIQRECDAIGYCRVGGAVITGGGSLKARYVIHAVGPVAGDPDADQLLESATQSSLRVAAENQLRSITFPAISTGVFGYPMDRCAHIMLATTIDDLRRHSKTTLERVVFCLYGQSSHDIFHSELICLIQES